MLDRRSRALIPTEFLARVIRTNEFAIQGYEFVRLFLLYMFEQNGELPRVDIKFITCIFSLIGQSRNGRGKQSTIPEDMVEFYNDVFSLIYPNKLYKSNLSHVLRILKEEMITCLETNIKTHFIEYFNKYVNVIHRDPSIKTVKDDKDYTKEEKKECQKAIHKTVKFIKTSLIECKMENNNSNEYYTRWIQDQILMLFPFEVKKNVAYHVKADPQKFIATAFVINKKIEELGRSPYQVIPHRAYALTPLVGA